MAVPTAALEAILHRHPVWRGGGMAQSAARAVPSGHVPLDRELPGRRGCVARELTKLHEETVRGTLAELADWARGRKLLGEFVLVVSGGGESS